MLVLYGVGEQFKKEVPTLLANTKEDILAVDTYPEKYPDGVVGYRVYGKEVLKDLQESDCVYIASNKYFEEISKEIRLINQKGKDKKTDRNFVETGERTIPEGTDSGTGTLRAL